MVKVCGNNQYFYLKNQSIMTVRNVAGVTENYHPSCSSLQLFRALQTAAAEVWLYRSDYRPYFLHWCISTGWAYWIVKYEHNSCGYWEAERLDSIFVTGFVSYFQGESELLFLVYIFFFFLHYSKPYKAPHCVLLKTFWESNTKWRNFIRQSFHYFYH